MHEPSRQYAKLLSTLVVRALLQELQDVHCSVEVATRQADADCRLVFVPREHPYFDSGKPQGLDGLLDFVLESTRRKGREKQSASCTTTIYNFE